MGGYGIVGGNLPIAAGLALASDYKGEDAVTVCMFGDGASNTGNFGETMNLAALWKPAGPLPGREQPLRDGDLGRAPLGPDRPLEEGRGLRRSRASGSTAWTCSRCARRVAEGIRHGARGAAADPARGLHLPLPRPLGRRPRGLPGARGGRGVAGEGPDRDLRAALRRGRRAGRARGAGRCASRPSEQVLAAVEFAEASPEPPLDTLYENLYVLDERRRLVRGRRAQPRAAPGRARGARCRTRRASWPRPAPPTPGSADGAAAQPGRRTATPRRGSSREVAGEVEEADRLMADAADARGAARRDGGGDAPRRGGLRDGRGRRRLPGRLQGDRRACSTSSASGACATRRSPRTRSSAPGSARRWAGCGRSSS